MIAGNLTNFRTKRWMRCRLYSRLLPAAHPRPRCVRSVPFYRRGRLAAITGGGMNHSPLLRNARRRYYHGTGGIRCVPMTPRIIILNGDVTTLPQSVSNADEEGRRIFGNDTCTNPFYNTGNDQLPQQYNTAITANMYAHEQSAEPVRTWQTCSVEYDTEDQLVRSKSSLFMLLYESSTARFSRISFQSTLFPVF